MGMPVYDCGNFGLKYPREQILPVIVSIKLVRNMADSLFKKRVKHDFQANACL